MKSPMMASWRGSRIDGFIPDQKVQMRS